MHYSLQKEHPFHVGVTDLIDFTIGLDFRGLNILTEVLCTPT